MAINFQELFYPHYSTHKNNYKKTGYPFAYYTNAETALKIIKSHKIWMRKPSMMNDYSEIEHGFMCLKAVLNTDVGKEFFESIDSIHVGLSAQINEAFTNTMEGIRSTTFIACFTEHSPLEDNLGRLSMWRAYGKNNGIAFIFKPELFFNDLDSNSVGVLSSPVAYLSPVEICDNLKLISRNIKSNLEELKATTNPDLIRNLILNIYSMAIICNKHNGFKEELEWRAITYSPISASPQLEKIVGVINGTPQAIQSFKFENNLEAGISGLNFNELLKRIIIGPCDHPEATKEALAIELTKGGFVNAHEIIHISSIPLRQN